jgi:hypothetical protein
MPLEKQVVHIPLAYGLQSKVDPRALTAPSLARAVDVQFEELGGIQPRFPFANWPTMGIRGGGTITAPRRLVEYRDELLLFTDTELFAWSEGDGLWIRRGTHLALSVEEGSFYTRAEEQVASDRAELDGVVVSCWVNVLGATTADHRVFIAARDADTGAVILPPLDMGAGTTQPRLVALSGAILFFYEDAAGDLRGHAINPSIMSVTPGGGAQIVAAATFNRMYDVCQSNQNLANALLVHRRDTTTSYSILRIPQTLAGITTTTKARPSVDAIAIASSPTAANRCVVVRHDGAAVEGDVLVETTFADSTIDAAVGPGGGVVDNIAAAFRTVQDAGVFRCYAFWSRGQTTLNTFDQFSNFVTSGGAVGTSDNFVQTTGIASRAFDHNGLVYVWLAFAQASNLADTEFVFSAQNSYFLFRDDGLLVAKAATQRGGGHQQLSGRLPAVQALGGGRYAWAGEERRIVPIGDGASDYSARVPLEVSFAFDDDRARRCVRLGETLYITGGQIVQYDGEGVAEVGFHTIPFRLGLVPGASGNLSAGAYAWRQLHRWDNARGERERSSSATTETETVAAGADMLLIALPFNLTLKFGATSHIPQGVRSPVVEEFYRSEANSLPGAPLKMVTSRNPAVSTGDNRFVLSSFSGSTSFNDAMSDDELRAQEPFPENDRILPSFAPPPATVIEATQDRIILSGIADRPNAVHYSRLRNDGEIASFHGSLRFELPPTGGRNTAVGFLFDTMVVFQETAIFAVPGDGFSNVLGAGGSNYGPGRLIASDIGAESQDAVALTPRGLMFKSRKGWYMLADLGSPRYIGAPVAAFDAELVRSIQVVESQHHIRVLTEARMLVWDYEADQWAEWPIADLAHGTLWRGQHVIIANDQVQAQAAALGAPVQLDVETGWINTGGIQGFQRIWWIMVLGQLLSTCRVRVRLALNYIDDVYPDDKIWVPAPGTIGGPMQVRHGPKIQQCQALKVRITALHASLDQAPVGGGFNLTALSLECGVQGGLFRELPAAQRQ